MTSEGNAWETGGARRGADGARRKRACGLIEKDEKMQKEGACLGHAPVVFRLTPFQNVHFAYRNEMTSATVMRCCSMVSRSRTVTVPFSAVSKSIVRQ